MGRRTEARPRYRHRAAEAQAGLCRGRPGSLPLWGPPATLPSLPSSRAHLPALDLPADRQQKDAGAAGGRHGAGLGLPRCYGRAALQPLPWLRTARRRGHTASPHGASRSSRAERASKAGGSPPKRPKKSPPPTRRCGPVPPAALFLHHSPLSAMAAFTRPEGPELRPAGALPPTFTLHTTSYFELSGFIMLILAYINPSKLFLKQSQGNGAFSR